MRIKKYAFILFIFASIFFTRAAGAVDSYSVGFVQQQIWYSKSPLVEGDNVKIHTVVWNGTSASISLHVEFDDKNVVLGSRDVLLDPSTLKDVSISWVVTSGDHYISAKITSSNTKGATDKIDVTPNTNQTSIDHQFVPVTIKTVDGNQASSADIIKNEVSKANSEIKNIVPSNIVDTTANLFSSIDSNRQNTYNNLLSIEKDTQKHLDGLNTNQKSQIQTPQNGKLFDATEKPITYVKLFLVGTLMLVFGNAIIFYSLCGLVLFITIRFIYRKIRR